MKSDHAIPGRDSALRCPDAAARRPYHHPDRIALLFCFFILHSAFCNRALGQAAIDWHGMVGGGGIGPAVGNYQLIGTIGQPVASNPAPDTNPGPNDQASLASGFLSVAVVDTFSTLALISSVNPLGFKDSVIFTASLPGNVTGIVVFKTNNAVLNTVSVLGAATSVSTASLPRQDNTIAAEYSGDFYHIPSTASLTQTVTNHPPAAGLHYLATILNTPLNISAATLASKDYDADGDPLTITAVSGPTSGGGLVALSDQGTITYTPPNNYVTPNAEPEVFTYAIADNFGGTNLGTAKVTVRLGQATSVFNSIAPVNGTVNLHGYGIPGHHYDIQVSSNMQDWTTLTTVAAAPNGVIFYTDTPPDGAGQRFYRFAVSSQPGN